MIRGTTPTLTFTLPFSTELLAEAWITFAQRGSAVFSKELCDCVADGNVLTVKLSQAETLQLDSAVNTDIQIRARSMDGNAIASTIITTGTGRILKDGVI